MCSLDEDPLVMNTSVTHSITRLFGDHLEVTWKLVVRERFALEENLSDTCAGAERDLRGCEVGGAEDEGHHALEVDVDTLPALLELEGEKGAIPTNICSTPIITAGA